MSLLSLTSVVVDEASSCGDCLVVVVDVVVGWILDDSCSNLINNSIVDDEDNCEVGGVLVVMVVIVVEVEVISVVFIEAVATIIEVLAVLVIVLLEIIEVVDNIIGTLDEIVENALVLVSDIKVKYIFVMLVVKLFVVIGALVMIFKGSFARVFGMVVRVAVVVVDGSVIVVDEA